MSLPRTNLLLQGQGWGRKGDTGLTILIGLDERRASPPKSMCVCVCFRKRVLFPEGRWKQQEEHEGVGGNCGVSKGGYHLNAQGGEENHSRGSGVDVGHVVCLGQGCNRVWL